jgi:hypothetical protein
MMNRRAWIRIAVAAAGISALLGATALFALDWPLGPPRIAATFGTPAKGRLVTGIALAADDALVHSADDGELSFALEEGKNPTGLPSALGSFVIVDHPKDLAGLYAHLAPGSVSDYLKVVKSGSILGKTGSSGWTEGPGLLFQVFDRREGQWVNPLLVLPPLNDDKAPVLRSLALVRNGRTYVLDKAASVPQGTYSITVDVADPADAAWTAGPLAPYSIRLTIDGTELVRDVFDVAEGKDGRLCLFPKAPRNLGDLRSKDGRYVLAERLFSRGRVLIEVSAEDASGNRRSASWSVTVE